MTRSQQSFEATGVSASSLTVLQQEIELGGDALRRGAPDMAVTFFQSALSKMDSDFPFFDHVVHNLLTAYKALIENLLRSGDLSNAIGFLNSALSLELKGAMSADQGFRRRFADVFQNLGLVFFNNAQPDASIACCRKAISTYACPSYHVNLNNALSISGRPALLSDFDLTIKQEDLGRHLFIACVPKSASTFLKNVLLSLTAYREMFAVYAAGQNEHDLYLPTISEFATENTVTQQHCRASDANIRLMQAFGIRPIVLVRNIFDSVMSLLDFYNLQGAYFNTYFRTDFASLDEETQVDLLIDNVVPWYLQFVSSWSTAERNNQIEVMWLGFEDLIDDKPKAVLDVLRFYGLGAPIRDVEAKIKFTEAEERKTRFNKGVAGRGITGISDSRKERIRRMTRFYPTTDFGRIGL